MTITLVNDAIHAAAPAVPQITTTAATGNLNGRRIIPLSFYLLVGTSILAVIATIALAALAMWPYAIAAGAFALTQIVSAYSLYRNSGGEAMNEAANTLSTQVANLTTVNQTLNNDIATMQEENTQLHNDIHELDSDMEEKLKELTDIKNKIVAYAKSHKTEKEALRKNLDSITTFLQGNGKDLSGIEQMRNTVNDIQLEEADFENIQKCLTDLTNDNKNFMTEVQAILKAIKDYNDEFTADVKQLAIENTVLSKEIADEKKIDLSLKDTLAKIRRLLKKRTAQLEALKTEVVRTNTLLQAQQTTQAAATTSKPKNKIKTS